MARRKGNTWYLGLMVGNEARSFTLSLDFLDRSLYFLEAGQVTQIGVVGQFADQADVMLPMDYVNARVLDESVATLSSTGVVTSRGQGTTALLVQRGDIAAGTAIGTFDSRSWIGDVNVPVSLVATMSDPVVSRRRQTMLFDLIHDATIFRVDADHGAVVEGARRFVPALLRALSSVEGRLE
jgi:hypothetical protein